MQFHFRHRAMQRLLRLAALAALGLALLAALAAPSAAYYYVQPPAGPPTIPPAAPTLDGSDDPILNPFPGPITEAMTDTVRAVLAVYATIPEDARSAHLVGMAVPNSGVVIYLPAIRVARTAPPPPTPTPRPARPADIAAAIWPEPSIIVMRSAPLTYELRLRNYGKGEAKRALVTLPYANSQLAVISSRFTDPRDWVSAVTSDHVDVTFGPIAAGEYRTAAIIFRVREALPDRTVISMRASYSWDDHRSGGAWRSNWAPVLVGAGNAGAPWVPLWVDPLGGPAGTTHHFFSDRFIPSEGIYTWLNTPQGVRPLELRGVADLLGRAWLDFSSAGLAPGTYQLVAYGARSNLTGVATFVVK